MLNMNLKILIEIVFTGSLKTILFEINIDIYHSIIKNTRSIKNKTKPSLT
jgi:hypothetical protein